MMIIAKTILEQLGGHKFAFMTGAKTFIGSDDTLRFALPRRLMSITLDPSDTYTVRLISKRTGKEQARREGVYAEQLREVFTAMTGLYTSF